jgi:hypothetical protein
MLDCARSSRLLHRKCSLLPCSRAGQQRQNCLHQQQLHPHDECRRFRSDPINSVRQRLLRSIPCVTPSKSGFVFNPLSTIFISSSSLSENKTASFVGTPSSALPSGMPVLLTQENSLRALALDFVTMTSEPFAVTALHNFSADQRTRVSLFAVNVELGAGETTSIIAAQAEDSLG